MFSAGRSACPELAELMLASRRIHFAKIAIGPNCATGSIVINLAVVAECLILLLPDVVRASSEIVFVDVLALQQLLYEEAIISCQTFSWFAL
jgi:Ca2+/Na+ antiporter